MDLRTCAITRLASVSDIDISTPLGTVSLFTVPEGYSCIITQILLREPSTSISSNSLRFGFNDPDYDDVSGGTTYTIATGGAANADLRATIPVGLSGQALKLYIENDETATLKADIFGYLIPN
jgi:hypothetical protein